MKRWNSVALLLLVQSLWVSAVSAALIGAEWQTFGPTSQGSLNGVGFTLSGLDEPANDQFPAARPFFAQLEDRPYLAAPLGRQRPAIEYLAQSDWSLTFDAPANGLYLYVVSWRPGTYAFDRTFEFSGFGLPDRVVAQNDNGELIGRSTFSDGILFFPGPITQLNVEGPENNDGYQVMTWATVPQPNALGLLALGAVGLRHRTNR